MIHYEPGIHGEIVVKPDEPFHTPDCPCLTDRATEPVTSHVSLIGTCIDQLITNVESRPRGEVNRQISAGIPHPEAYYHRGTGSAPTQFSCVKDISSFGQYVGFQSKPGTRRHQLAERIRTACTAAQALQRSSLPLTQDNVADLRSVRDVLLPSKEEGRRPDGRPDVRAWGPRSANNSDTVFSDGADTRRLCVALEKAASARLTMLDVPGSAHQKFDLGRCRAVESAKRVALKFAADFALDQMVQTVAREVALVSPSDDIPEDSEWACSNPVGRTDVEDFLTAYKNTNLMSAKVEVPTEEALSEFTRLSAKFAQVLHDAGETHTASTASRLPRHAAALEAYDPSHDDDAQKRSFQDVLTEWYNDQQRVKGGQEHPLHRPAWTTWQTMTILALNERIKIDKDDCSVMLSDRSEEIGTAVEE